MLDKQEVLEELNLFVVRYNLDKSDIQVLGGAALVIRGLREHAVDLDLYLCKEECQRLLSTGDFEEKIVESKPDVVWLVSESIDIRNTHYVCDVLVDGFPIQSLESILSLKLKLNRDKDKNDVRIIQAALKRS